VRIQGVPRGKHVEKPAWKPMAISGIGYILFPDHLRELHVPRKKIQWSLEIWNRLFPAHFEVLNVAPGQFNYDAIANIDLGCSCKLLLKANTGQLPQADTFFRTHDQAACLDEIVCMGLSVLNL